MNIEELRLSLRELAGSSHQYSRQERIACVNLLVAAASGQIAQLRQDLSEEDAATRRRQAKRRETELDPKPPVKPVRVAAPSKPRKPKYSGNHAPTAPR